MIESGSAVNSPNKNKRRMFSQNPQSEKWVYLFIHLSFFFSIHRLQLVFKNANLVTSDNNINISSLSILFLSASSLTAIHLFKECFTYIADRLDNQVDITIFLHEKHTLQSYWGSGLICRLLPAKLLASGFTFSYYLRVCQVTTFSIYCLTTCIRKQGRRYAAKGSCCWRVRTFLLNTNGKKIQHTHLIHTFQIWDIVKLAILTKDPAVNNTPNSRHRWLISHMKIIINCKQNTVY